MKQNDLSNTQEARRWLLGGLVQGVGYRAFVFNLAERFALAGVVQNLGGEVLVEAQGRPPALDAFATALVMAAPPLAKPRLLSSQAIALRNLTGFEILPSAVTSQSGIHVPPDSFLCDDCRRELHDPDDRRYRYPFINCTQCGPRYTLITRLPYDRPNTTLACFPLCPSCRAEYENPRDRRFHAQPLACPACGPRLSFVSPHTSASGDAALAACIAALRRGETVAVKGIGGYHLLCDATNAAAITRLRNNKRRPHKPLAVMFPYRGEDGLQSVRMELQLDATAEAALCDVSRPIVLLPRLPGSSLPEVIAPKLHEIGAMLPYSPLHHLLLDGFGLPLIATSGNVSGEPVLTDNTEAEARLAQVAQAFLHHNRPIARPADDSVLRIVCDKPRLLRAGRGIAPREFDLPLTLKAPLLAVGGHMKNAVALGWGRRMVLSPHIGDLDAPRGQEIFEQVIADLQQLYGVSPLAVVCDLHPDYASSRWAKRISLPVHRVQHHHAHAAALAWEAGLDKKLLVFTWDGAGLGSDGTLWGGEALLGNAGTWQRAATLKPFRLPGGERAAREPWRSAASLCWESGIEWHSAQYDEHLLHNAWQQGLNTAVNTAAGRLFDGASNLLGLIDQASFEGQGPMLLEAAAQSAVTAEDAEVIEMPLHENGNGLVTADWTPLIQAMLRFDMPIALRALQFHASLAHSIAAQARLVHARTPFDAVGLTGGVFQNKLLAELTVQQLSAAGFAVHLPQEAPCNDGGLALGQLIEAAHQHG